MKLLQRALSNKNSKLLKIIGLSLFIIWIGFILCLTLVREPHDFRVFRPDLFYEFREWVTGSVDGARYIKLFIENILLFIPFGFFIPWKKNWLKVLITGFLFSGGIEFLQYVTMLGECEIDDIITNATGTMIGYYLFIVFGVIYRKIKEKRFENGEA